MPVSRALVVASLTALTATVFFQIGQWTAERLYARAQAESDARLDALRAEMRQRLAALAPASTALVGTSGTAGATVTVDPVRERLVEDIKLQLRDEMGLLPLDLLRARRQSFVELYALDNLGKTNYGTAGYLGKGYFITVKHGVVVLPEESERRRTARRIESIRLEWAGRKVAARVVDTGDADVEVHSGDWAIVKVDEPVDLPPLRVNRGFAWEFADPIFRLGNDYSKGIILSTGYVGQRTSSGLVTCLTDGHPGVSGGGVLNREGELVGIPIGRMQGDYRFSFILPVRSEMFRKVK